MSLDTAKTVAIVIVAVLVLGAVVAAWVMKTIGQKMVAVAVLAVLAAVVWSQRTSLQECADGLKDNLAAGAPTDTTCSFFGSDITSKGSQG